MSTETLASCPDDAQTGAVQISAANKTDLTIGKDCFLANVVCWFDSDTARDAASVSVVGMVDWFFNDALFRRLMATTWVVNSFKKRRFSVVRYVRFWRE